MRHPDFPTDDHFHIILSRRPLAALAQLVYTCVYQFRDNWKSLSVLDLSKEVLNNGQGATKISEFKVGGQKKKKLTWPDLRPMHLGQAELADFFTTSNIDL